MIRDYAQEGSSKRSAVIDILKADSESIIAFGNELSILRLMLKYSKDFGNGNIWYWTRFNSVIAEDLAITNQTISKHLKLFMDFGIIHRISIGYYGFNEKFIKVK